MYRRLLTALMTLLFTVTQASAQMLQASLSHYSTDDGLASDAIADIIQDDYGYLWIATWNGLTRFDGYNFYNYKTGNGSHIPHLHNRIFQLLTDQQQNVWMRMYDGRIFLVDRHKDMIVNPFEGVSGSEEYRTDVPLFLTSSGRVLTYIEDVGLYLMRFDQGKTDMQFINSEGLNVTCLTEGYHNDIWVGTDKGVHRVDLANLSLERRGMFEDEPISALYSNGYNIWVGTKQGSIYQFAYGQKSQQLRKPSGQQIIRLFVDSHGVIWIGDPRFGISRIKNGEEKLFQQRVLVPEYDGYGGIVKESAGIVWVRMNHGGYGYYNREKDEVGYFHNDPSNPWNLSNTVNAACELPEGVIFLSTSRRGLEKLELTNSNITRKLLIPNAVSTIENEIRGMLYDPVRKRLLMGNKHNSLFIFNSDSTHTVITHDSKGNPIGRTYGLALDSKGNYWLCSKDHGVFKITPTANGGYDVRNYCQNKDDKYSLCSNAAYQSVEDQQGNIWVATYGGGVNVLTRNSEGKEVIYNHANAIRNYPHNSYLKARTIIIDKEETVWAGTTDGILLLTMDGQQVSARRLTNSRQEPDKILMSNDIVCIACDKEGTVWVGTNGGGLSRTIGKDKDGNWLFETFGFRDGLPSEEIRSITFDSRGNTWFATDHVLCSFDVQKRIFTTFSSLDGVDATMCSEGGAITLPNDNILFGTINGYYLVDRSKLVTDNGAMLKLRITDFLINDEIVSPRMNNYYDFYVPESEGVVLPSHDAAFGFRFAAMNYQLQHRVHYQYMLEGYEHTWRNGNKSHMANYTNVPTGKYKFKVKAFLLESPDKFDMRTIDVEVPPHFLLSENAIWLYIVLTAIILPLAIYLRKRYIRKKISKMKVLKLGPQELAFADQEDYDFVKAQYDWLEQHHADTNLRIDDLVAQAGMSRSDYHSKLKQLTGFTPKELVADFRQKKTMYLKQKLKEAGMQPEQLAKGPESQSADNASEEKTDDGEIFDEQNGR